ncbi:AT-hook motif nuclear-localized protein 18-like [Zingiber officinale]|uniref:AT-hook motif nuclear-localized protein 18-like n=1 Tax=Zingiber officinale TaxID=94328 RepID=UPI001C4A76DC|nr:AT-hook motif nuclear-localized protein 18-like [Zingiber officinale]
MENLLPYLAQNHHHLYQDGILQQANNGDQEELNNSNNNEGGGSGSELGEQGSSRKRGRPTGSKNKPKPPVVITRESTNAMRAHVMEVAAGNDVLESVIEYARRRQVGVTVVSGTGAVVGATVRSPLGGIVPSLRGRFKIVSLSGSILPPSSLPAASWMTVYLADGQGQVVGGRVVGPMVAAETVMLMVLSFSNATYEQLPLRQEEPPELDCAQLQRPLTLPFPLQQLAGGNDGNNSMFFQGHLPPPPPPPTSAAMNNLQLPTEATNLMNTFTKYN